MITPVSSFRGYEAGNHAIARAPSMAAGSAAAFASFLPTGVSMMGWVHTQLPASTRPHPITFFVRFGTWVHPERDDACFSAAWEHKPASSSHRWLDPADAFSGNVMWRLSSTLSGAIRFPLVGHLAETCRIGHLLPGQWDLMKGSSCL